MSVVLTMLALLAGDATTISVENSSPRAFVLKTAEIPSHYEPLSIAALKPMASVRSVSRRGKIFVPHADSVAETVRLHFADERGNGCIFHVAATDHSASWKKMKPRAERLGDAVCEARTGRTIGDFVYVVR
jgi:hypothetical protein